MRREITTKLIERLKSNYPDTFLPYGTSDEEEEGTGFRIADIPATFSVLSYGDIPSDKFDVQIESYPPGNYLYNDEIGLDSFLQLIEIYRKPMNQWPGYDAGTAQQGECT